MLFKTNSIILLMEQTIHFPLYINAPAEIPITHEQFERLSYIGVASFFVSYGFVIHDTKDENKSLKVYLSDRWFWTIRNDKKNDQKLAMAYYSSAEFGYMVLHPGDRYYELALKCKTRYFKEI